MTTYRQRIRTVYMPWQSHPWHGIRIVVDRAQQTCLGWVFIRPAVCAADASELDWTRPHDEEVGYRYCRAAWGRGIATEAARPMIEMALADPATASIVACARADNLGSLRVLEKLGLQRVGQVMLPDTDQPTVKLARTNQHPPKPTCGPHPNST